MEDDNPITMDQWLLVRQLFEEADDEEDAAFKSA